MDKLVSAASDSPSTVCKVLIPTRLSQGIKKRLRHKQKVSLSDEKAALQTAIRVYILNTLATLDTARLVEMKVTRQDLEQIQNRIVERADGSTTQMTPFVLSDQADCYRHVSLGTPGPKGARKPAFV